MTQMIEKAGLQVAEPLVRFLEDRALPGAGLSADAFWAGLADIYARFAPENAALLARRDEIQAQIDAWHQARPGQPIDAPAYQAFLRELGYLAPEPAPFEVSPTPSTTRWRGWPALNWWCRSSTPASC